MARKAEEHFASGAQQVWHMFRETRPITVFRSLRDVTIYQPDEIDLNDLLPGFRSRVAEMFRKKK